MFVQWRGGWPDRLRVLYIARFSEDKRSCSRKTCATRHVEYHGKVDRVMRTRTTILMCCATGWGVLALSGVAAADAHRERARIPHLDGSGRATIVEIDPGVPGRSDFLRATPEPIPKPGELVLPPKSPAPSPSPRRR
jgi:hypothetical protein